MAACYAHDIVKNHPFIDGNIRTGFVLAALFLENNGIAEWLRKSCASEG